MTNKYNTLTDFYREEIAPKLDKTDGWLAFDSNYSLYWYQTEPEYDNNMELWYDESGDFKRIGGYQNYFTFDMTFSDSLQSVKDLKNMQNKKYHTFFDFYNHEIIPSLDKTDGYLAMDNDYEVFWYSEKPVFNGSGVWTAKNRDYSTCDVKSIKTIDSTYFYSDMCFDASMYPVSYFIKEEKPTMKIYDMYRDFYLEEVMPNINKKTGYLAIDANGMLYWYAEKPKLNSIYDFWYAVDDTDSDYIKEYNKNLFTNGMDNSLSLYSIEELLPKDEAPVELTKLYKLTGLPNKELGIVSELELGQFFSYVKEVNINNTHVLTTSSGYIFFHFNTMLYRAELI